MSNGFEARPLGNRPGAGLPCGRFLPAAKLRAVLNGRPHPEDRGNNRSGESSRGIVPGQKQFEPRPFRAPEGSEIYYSRTVNGAYQTPEPLSAINDVGQVICPFIAPDESYIIFNKLEPGGGRSEGYFISFEASDGQWLAPQSLPVFPEAESSFVTRDGLYIFNKAYWASTQMIEDLRPSSGMRY